VTDFQREREALGTWLTQLRRDSGLSGKELAARLVWQPSKVSRIELGKQTATRQDVTSWARAVGNPDAAGELTARVVALETHYVSHRRSLSQGHAALQRSRIPLENAAGTLRVFECGIIPGLLQTADYARAIFARMEAFKHLTHDADEAVRARLQRQQVLYDLTKQFHFLLTAGALRARPCPVPVMRAQLDRLVTATTLPNLRLGIIPDEAELRLPPMHGFWIIDERLVQVEVFAADLNLSDESEIRLHLDAFDLFAASALYGPDARAALIRHALALPDTGAEERI
jgi:transcriptional regulator with XRE-family HTH domain